MTCFVTDVGMVQCGVIEHWGYHGLGPGEWVPNFHGNVSSIYFAWLLSICPPLPPKKSLWQQAVGESCLGEMALKLVWAKQICQEWFPTKLMEEEWRMREGCYFYPISFRCCLDPWCYFLLRVGRISRTWPICCFVVFSTVSFCNTLLLLGNKVQK